MAETHVLSALHRKYSMLLGELRQCEDRTDALRADIAHLEATIRLFSDDWDGSTVKPRRPRAQCRWLRKGQGMQTAMEVLREAPEPLTARELALQVMERRGLSDASAEAVKAIVSSLNSTLKRRIGNGVVCHGGFPKRWSLDR